MKHKPVVLAACVVICLGIAGPTAAAESYDVVEDESLFAVVLHKAGIGSALAHNHLIAAINYEADAAYDPADPGQVRFSMKFPVENLVADHPELAEEWSPRIIELGILDEELSTLDESTRDDIRGSMLGEKQLDAENYPAISAELRELRKEETTLYGVDFEYIAVMALTVHGETVETPVSMNIEQREDNRVHLEGVGEYAFTSFGIKPYSAFFGAVKNKDRFHVFVNATLEAASGDAASGSDEEE